MNCDRCGVEPASWNGDFGGYICDECVAEAMEWVGESRKQYEGLTVGDASVGLYPAAADDLGRLADKIGPETPVLRALFILELAGHAHTADILQSALNQHLWEQKQRSEKTLKRPPKETDPEEADE